MRLTMREEQRINVMQEVLDKKITRAAAGRALGVKERQVYRMLEKVRGRGIRGLIHGNKGKESPRKIPESFWRRVVRIVRKKYLDVNDLHLQKLLEREEGIVVTRESLRKRFRAAKIGPKQKRRSTKFRM
ncbi:MAG: helix-turn-helix domain-containing protein [Deltaproteobacteria bacterium]|nr:helix-turn-helix domain-containing protein [Deltaproteobacteria bacterium]